jgi:hypothetical protein
MPSQHPTANATALTLEDHRDEVNEETAAELARFARADQDFRGSLPDGPLDPELTMQWARLDVGHTDRLREIIDQYAGRDTVSSARMVPSMPGCWLCTPTVNSISNARP